MKAKIPLSLLMIAGGLLCSLSLFAQIKVNETGSSAVLEVTTTNKGLLIPRVSAANRPLSPTESMQIFNTTSQCLEYYVNGVWQPIACKCNVAPPTPSSITGSTSVTTGSYSYSIPATFGADSYLWSSASSGTTVTSGATTGTATIQFTTTGTKTINVSAKNSCGTSSNQTLTVTVL